MTKCLFIFLILFLSIHYLNCLYESNAYDILNVNVYDVITKEVGIIGTVIVKVDNGFLTTKKNIFFKSNISNFERVDCGFFAGEITKKPYIFCNVNSNHSSGNYTLKLNDVGSFIYRNYNVSLKVNPTANLSFFKVDRNITDLYSDEQTIVIDNKKDFYKLSFKVVSYNKESFFLNKYMLLNNCYRDSNILECLINKNNLLGYLSPYQNTVSLSHFDNKTYTINEFPLVPINIVQNYTIKEDIFVKIGKLLINDIDGRGVITYETNITNISNYYLLYKGFNLTFIKTNSASGQSDIEFECHFIKYDNNSLLLLCFINEEGEFVLKNTTEETIISNFSIKYNYRIQNITNNDIIRYNKTGSFISWYYPKVLDFDRFDSIAIYFNVDNSEDLNGLTFNEDKGDLKCENIRKNLKKCEVTKDHFKEKEEGFYFIKHTNHLKKKIISYEVPPIKIILEEPNSGIIKLAIIYSSVIFVAVLLLIVI